MLSAETKIAFLFYWWTHESPLAERHYRRILALYEGRWPSEVSPLIESSEAPPCDPLLQLIVSQQGGRAVPRSWSDDDKARERRRILPLGLQEKYRHVHRSREDAEHCPICCDPVCDCGAPGWGCECSEQDEERWK